MKKTILTAAMLVAASNTAVMAGNLDAAPTEAVIIMPQEDMAAPLSSSLGGAVLPVLVGLAVIAAASSGGGS